ncbi:MAG: glycosyltransferase family 4 protein [Anaerolineaceae bacterium]|nr:glycosyltransferase family 4 protein [Anaerolineaceae bacterium]
MLLTQLKLLGSISKYDVLYIRSHIMTLPSMIMAILLKIPMVLEFNGPYHDLFLAWPFTRYFSGLLIFLMKYQMRLAKNIIVVTPQLKDWVVNEIDRDNIFVIENGADIDHFFPGAQNDFPLDKEYVIFFGALTVWQGIDDILNATNDDQWPKDLMLIIAGDGIKKDEVVRSGNKNIKYLGVVPYELIPGLIAGSLTSLVCMNNIGSRSDTGLSPLKLYESLACGVPVIVTDLPGISDFVKEHDCGIIIPLNSPKSIVNAVTKIFGDRTYRDKLGKNGLDVVTRDHSWTKRAIDTDKIIQYSLQAD